MRMREGEVERWALEVEGCGTAESPVEVLAVLSRCELQFTLSGCGWTRSSRFLDEARRRSRVLWRGRVAEGAAGGGELCCAGWR